MTDLLIVGKRALAAQPFSRLLGAELTEFSAELVEIVVPITEQIKQQNGFVHGGVISYAADNALTFAGGAALGAAVVTSEYKINYLKPGIGAKLIARAMVIHAGKNQVVCRCDVFAVGADGAEILCAAAQGTIVKLPDRSARDV
ncbi:MAG: PaaI family thioesterase [Acidobacteriota bacterium]|nr:PaaI family thioesterase [Acidobacteriota bacterium]